MKVLVTGANGYLGQGIVKALLDKGAEVIATDIAGGQIDDRAEKILCNLFEVSDPYNYFRQPDAVLHLAWRNGFEHYSDAHIEDIPKHYQFIQTLAGSGVKKITGMGSMHEIGFYEGCIKEDTPCNPVTPYGISKNALRELTRLLCEKNGVLFQWLRGYYIVGNSEYGSSIFSKLYAAEKEGKEEFPFTMGLNQYDFIDYDDFCAQVASAVCQDEILGIINIGSGGPEKLSDRVERFIRDNHFRIRLHYGAFPDRPYDSKAVWGDGEKIRMILEREKGTKDVI